MLEALDRGEPVPGPARRPPPAGIAITTSSPTCCGRACWTSSPSCVPELHRRASEWYEQHGEPPEAIRHALAARGLRARGRPGRAGDPGACARVDRRRRCAAWLDGAARRASSAAGRCSASRYAGVLLVSGELEGVEGRLRDAERWLDATRGARRTGEPPAMVVVDERGVRAPAGAIAIYRAALARLRGDVAGTDRARPAGARPRRRGRPSRARGGGRAPRARATGPSGDLEAAHRLVCRGHGAACSGPATSSDALGCAHRAGRHPDRAGPSSRGDARPTSRRCSWRRARRAGAAAARRTCTSGMSELHRERNDLAAATAAPAGEPGARASTPACRRTGYRWRVAMARIREAEGDLDGALELLDEAERLYVGDFSPNVRPIAAVKARVWIAQGRLAEALRLGARARPVGRRRPQLPARVRAHHARAGCSWPGPARPRRRARCARQRSCSSVSCDAAEDGRRTGSVIEILVLQALAHQARGDIRGRARRRSSARWRWPSRRATSGSSSTRARRWRRCSTRPRSSGIAPAYVRDSWQPSPRPEAASAGQRRR